jgi:rhodanese-related sulfurtransferase
MGKDSTEQPLSDLKEPEPEPRSPRVTSGHPITLTDVLLILIVSAGVAVLFNSSSPNGVALLPESLFRPHPRVVTAAEAKRMLEEDNAVLVDARPVELYRIKHIRGAVNVPLDVFDVVYQMKLNGLVPERRIIVYGRTISRHFDEEVAHRLTQRDREDVVVFTGGLSAWERQGFPVEQ